jgi:hypothetical protein
VATGQIPVLAFVLFDMTLNLCMQVLMLLTNPVMYYLVQLSLLLSCSISFLPSFSFPTAVLVAEKRVLCIYRGCITSMFLCLLLFLELWSGINSKLLFHTQKLFNTLQTSYWDQNIHIEDLVVGWIQISCLFGLLYSLCRLFSAHHMKSEIEKFLSLNQFLIWHF